MTTIDDLIRRGGVQRVPVDARAIDRLMDDARRHLATAEAALESGDLAGAFSAGVRRGSQVAHRALLVPRAADEGRGGACDPDLGRSDRVLSGRRIGDRGEA